MLALEDKEVYTRLVVLQDQMHVSHVAGHVPQSQSLTKLDLLYSELPRANCVCEACGHMCWGLHVRVSVSPPHHEHGGGGESRAQPSAPTVMFLPPQISPPALRHPPPLEDLCRFSVPSPCPSGLPQGDSSIP